MNDPDLALKGQYFYVAAAYAVTAVLLGLMILQTVWQARRSQRRLRHMEASREGGAAVESILPIESANDSASAGAQGR